MSILTIVVSGVNLCISNAFKALSFRGFRGKVFVVSGVKFNYQNRYTPLNTGLTAICQNPVTLILLTNIYNTRAASLCGYVDNLKNIDQKNTSNFLHSHVIRFKRAVGKKEF